MRLPLSSVVSHARPFFFFPRPLLRTDESLIVGLAGKFLTRFAPRKEKVGSVED